MKQPPAFQFYASDYLSSSKVQRMSLEEEGAYIRLLCYNWQDGWVPNDIGKLARMCKTSQRKMERIWQVLRDCFGPMPEFPDRLVNPRLEHTRAGFIQYAEKQRVRAKQRWESHGNASTGNATALPRQSQERHEPGNALQSSVSSLQSSIEEEIQKPLSASADRQVTKYPAGFEQFWNESTKRGSKLEAYREWKKIKDHATVDALIFAGMAAWRESEQWQDETKQPHICRWLKRRGWEEIVPRGSNANSIERRNTEAARRLLSRLDSQDRGSIPSEPGRIRASGLSRTSAEALFGSDPNGSNASD